MVFSIGIFTASSIAISVDKGELKWQHYDYHWNDYYYPPHDYDYHNDPYNEYERTTPNVTMTNSTDMPTTTTYRTYPPPRQYYGHQVGDPTEWNHYVSACSIYLFIIIFILCVSFRVTS